jgi:hypothetical protein
MDEINNIPKPKCGRRARKSSFVIASMAQLQSLNPNPNFLWRISRRQLEAMGVNDLGTDRVSAPEKSATEAPSNAAPMAKVTDF